MARGFFLSPSQLSNSGICHGVEGGNGGFYSHLSVMPLKSDGSLCIMEALSRSQPQGIVSSSSPKLEDFLSGASATMGTHHQYGSNDREAMALSLNSMYYHQNSESEVNRQASMSFLQQPFRQQHQQQIHIQHHPYFSGLTGHSLYQAPLEQTKETQLAEMEQDETPSLRNWVDRNYSTNHAMDHKMVGFLYDEGGGGFGSVGAMGYGDLQSLSLSMSPGSQSSCITAPQQISSTGTESVIMETKKRGTGKVGQKQPVHRKSIDTFGQRTSQYRGVTRHRWTGRYEAHLWDNSCKKEGQTRKGRQGGYDMEDKAARSYDLAALKYWGPSTYINFPLENYQEQLEEMKNMSRQEYVAHLRRKSSGFSRGASMYRGVTRHHQHGRWQARIGRVAGNKDLYLGTFSTQEEAAEAYDIAAIKFRGVSAVTNFDITRYDVERIIASNDLLSSENAKRNKQIVSTNDARVLPQDINHVGQPDWKMVLHQSTLQHPSNAIESPNEKLEDAGNYRNPSFTGELNDLIELHSTHQGAHLSNASSLVTSLGSSREGSPDKTGLSMLFTRPPPSASMTNMSMFAAWSDA
ncbi:hypothetical protein GIB67_018943 [Kingdonia uniflora]|uniref:AP2/ERF domain-containing protein n=1 Tax=Kingdonia uniflora TaxID=39325 RepID=A0A7J7L2X1_9MAGN|nr:hypothetical protein GIB67_018943 [Kingdonia uniflora]